MPLLLFVIIVVLVWMFLAPSRQFLPGFARLLTAPSIEQGPLSFFSGRSYARGRFEGRDVAIRLQLKRSRYGQGYLVVALRTEGLPALSYDRVEVLTPDDARRRALSALATHDLLPSVEGGWLKAQWKPQGFVIFPGRFSEEKWRDALQAMHVLATALETAA